MAVTDVRRLIVVLGDQLDLGSTALRDVDPRRDVVWMCESADEATAVWSHQARIAVFLAAMRHFAEDLRARGLSVRYHRTEDERGSLAQALAADLDELRPGSVVVTQPGEYRVEQTLREAVEAAGVEWDCREDEHFLCSAADFAEWIGGRKQPRMEHFYRWMRRRTGWLMEAGEPVGGRWNFDADNRGAFTEDGPGLRPDPRSFPPDPTTQEVLDLVARRYGDHPGSLASFDWPLTREDALLALADFVDHRLARFGEVQDAMWSGEPWPAALLFHSRLSVALNLKLLDPREVIDAVVEAHVAGRAPIGSVEGFVRQVLGWREYVRGLYWQRMPEFVDANALDAQLPLPELYWTGETEFACLRETVGETLRHGYAHHIQRLMVTGLFGLLLGVSPRAMHEWYLAVYVDAVEWVELPNTIGMSQYADGGVLGSKPYVASGAYIDRMSDYCSGCPRRPDRATGDDACPFTTLYWDFLDRHRSRFAEHPRMTLQVRNLDRREDDLPAIRAAAAELRERLVSRPRPGGM